MVEPQLDPLDKLDEIVEGAASEAATGTETVTESDDPPAGQPRSDDGRYASPEDKPPEGQADPAAEVETPEGEADAGTAEKPAEPTPYSYRADARTYDVMGATVGPDGVLSIPQESVPHVTQLLASGRAWSDSRPRELAALQQQIAQAQAEVNAVNQTRAALLDQFETVVKMTEEQRLDWAAGFGEEWPGIRAKAEQAGAEASRQADHARLADYERQDFERTFEPQFRQGLSDFILREQKSDPRFKGLTRDDLEVVFGKLADGWQNNGVLLTAEGAAWNGERNPQANEALIRREMEYAVSFRRQENESAEQTATAQKANAAELKDGKAPPAVKSTTGGTPADGKPVRQFKPSGKEGSDPAEESLDYLMDMEVPADL